MDNIVVYLNPFKISSPPEDTDIESYKFDVGGESISGIDDVEWCSLPDLLLDENSRKFIGLSFSLIDEYTNFIKKLVGVVANSNCRYISSENGINRYEGFGGNDRLEIYWDDSDGEIICEFASLYEGCWLYAELGKNKSSLSIPYGYWLSLVGDIKENYDLV